MKTFARCCTLALTAVVLAVALPAPDAHAGGRYGHGGGYHRGGGPGWGGVVLGLGVGLGLGYWSGARYTYGPPVYAEPGYVLVDPPPVVYREVPRTVYREVPAVVYREAPAVAYRDVPAAPSRPEPIIYPRNGQSAQQIEADRQACNRWATTQPSAMADAGVFNRATEACMDGRGYTIR